MATEQVPRKKRKKRDNTLLYIILGVVAGVVVLVLVVVLIVVIAMNIGGGDPQARGNVVVPPPLDNKAPEKPPEQQPPKDIGGKKRDQTNWRLRIERPQRLNELRQIALFYQDYRSINNDRPPATVEAFLKHIAREAPEIKKAIEDDYYKIRPNVRSGIIAYEFDPDTRGMHGIVDTGGSAREMSTEELLEAKKQQGQ